MSMLRDSAHFFRDYFRLSAADSGRIWQGFSPEARYGYLAALLQWQVDEAEVERGMGKWKRRAHLAEEWRGYRQHYRTTVLQAGEGCGFDCW